MCLRVFLSSNSNNETLFYIILVVMLPIAELLYRELNIPVEYWTFVRTKGRLASCGDRRTYIPAGNKRHHVSIAFNIAGNELRAPAHIVCNMRYLKCAYLYEVVCPKDASRIRVDHAFERRTTDLFSVKQ